jgi:hypothetical protein
VCRLAVQDVLNAVLILILSQVEIWNLEMHQTDISDNVSIEVKIRWTCVLRKFEWHNVMPRQYDGVTMRWCDYVRMWHCLDVTMWWYDNVFIRYNFYVKSVVVMMYMTLWQKDHAKEVFMFHCVGVTVWQHDHVSMRG